MKGYVARKGNRWYAVVYEGTDPITRRERRSWHPAGCDRADAERLAARLVSERGGANDEARSLSFGAFLTSRWLPGKRLVLAASTYAGYRHNVEGHIVPALGCIGLRRLRAHHLEAFYDGLLHPRDGRATLAPKTVYEIHLVIRGALADAVRRGLVSRNVAVVAHAPRLRSIPKVEPRSWTAEQLRAFLRAAAGHRLFPALWVAAFTGLRRGELLGLRWGDLALIGHSPDPLPVRSCAGEAGALRSGRVVLSRPSSLLRPPPTPSSPPATSRASVIGEPASRAADRGEGGPLQFPRHPSDRSTPHAPGGSWAPAPGSLVPSVAFASPTQARLPLGPARAGVSVTTLQASLHAADRSVVPPRFAPGLSTAHGGFATGDPGVSPGRTRTGWLP
jgi:hypothetical protein